MTQTINKHQHIISLICVLALSIFICKPLLAGEVYKWTDESGNTHYSDIKPFNTESKNLKIKTQVSKPQLKTPQERALALDSRKQKELQTDEENRIKLEEQKKTDEFCNTVRSNLKKIAEKGRLKIIENGEHHYLSPEEISAKESELQRQLSDNC